VSYKDLNCIYLNNVMLDLIYLMTSKIQVVT